MNTMEAIRSRRSIRKYKKGVRIPQKHIDLLLEAAMMAPSACNRRPWEFVVVESEEKKQQVMQANRYAAMLSTASLAIIVCGRPDLQAGICDGFWPQDCSAAVENLLLAAEELGYGTCWCGTYPCEDRVAALQAALEITSVPLAVVSVGVPDESPAARGFFDPARVKYFR